MSACKNCESDSITEGVLLGNQGDFGAVGPKYHAGIFSSITKMYVDICNDCGEINRMYVVEDKKLNWVTKK